MRPQVYSNRIEDYLAAIAGCEAFFVAERDYGRIINYRQMGNDVFPDPVMAPDAETARLWGLRRQCRGIIFNLAGDVISPGFEKFWNLNERTETLLEHVDFGQPHVILEKLDGSLCRPMPLADGGYLIATKMGPTDVAANADRWVRAHDNYDRFMRDTISQGLMPLLEWCSRQNRIVIDYPQDRLVLLAVRDVRTGEYLPLNMMWELAGEYGVEVVRRYPGTVESMQHLAEETRDLQDQEGWVVWFENGYRLKVKASQYVAIHRAKEGILRENSVIEMMLDEKLDDVKSYLPAEDRENLERFETAFWQGVQNTAHAWADAFVKVKETYGADRKAFALGDGVSMLPHLRSAVFKHWNEDQVAWVQVVCDTIRKSISTLVKTDENRYLWGPARWQAHAMGDD
jgi:RNA ligase